jgi:hypothetical protein
MFLRSKDDQPDAGECATLAQMWTLSQRWYGDRLDASFVPRSIDATQQLLDDVGLTVDFWQLQH